MCCCVYGVLGSGYFVFLCAGGLWIGGIALNTCRICCSWLCAQSLGLLCLQ